MQDYSEPILIVPSDKVVLFAPDGSKVEIVSDCVCKLKISFEDSFLND